MKNQLNTKEGNVEMRARKPTRKIMEQQMSLVIMEVYFKYNSIKLSNQKT